MVQGQAFPKCLRVLEAISASGIAPCEMGQACGMALSCVEAMLEIFTSSAQPLEHRKQAGHTAASLLRSHKCQRNTFRYDIALRKNPFLR